jgi:hypothetical protein
VDYSHVFDLRRWRQRFRGEQAIRDEAIAEGRAPDATVDEVGGAPQREGDDPGNGYGTGTVGGPGWAGWG